MNSLENEESSWTVCPKCHGQGKRSRRLRKKVRLQYLKELNEFEQLKGEGPAPIRPKGHLEMCLHCAGSGLVPSPKPPQADTENYPHVAIIGGGIGGVALAVACLHRGIPFTLYERDSRFDERSQGYGLTLQQASKAIEGLGIVSLKEGVISTRHLVHTTEGKVVGEWGMRKWQHSGSKNAPKRTNIHIARQSLRLALLQQLGERNNVQWGHQIIDYSEYKHADGGGVDLTFLVKRQVNGQTQSETKHAKADLVVGADGIRSVVRQQLIGDDISPLRYLGCIVILGICPLADLKEVKSDLLDSATVFQTANGHERIYIMPYDVNTVMWQLSFPMPENEAKALSEQGAHALKAEACRRTQWHIPVPQIVAATKESLISGYPVYDRALLQPELLAKGAHITLIGDAAHPMSPFKGQGANQALLDALALARDISKGCRPLFQWREAGIRDSVLNEFENQMLERSSIKVQDSAAAAQFLHSEVVLHEANEPRGRSLKRDAEQGEMPD
ncbi:FAD-dependent urate hydroxylase [Marinomonas spartinae]|uniref:FAD-dependent urate hydroxylase n=1 Tax=Marinomonas spartinae TaxID=1792290 RepID=A0A1A8TT39_9GAMM|nr:NAD(P)/FAD-dependent oxidoreductase [Marinomonas spartinae]SBS36528.1 FAD-dependent urate hydroxylase [Marinomonas spartinae]